MTFASGKSRSALPVLFVLLLLLLLAVVSGALITAGSGIYGRITANMEDNFSARVSLSYIAEQIRQGDGEGCVSVRSLGSGSTRSLGGVDCLVVEDREWQYFTCVYFYEGYIYESLVEFLEDFDPYMGEQVIKAGGLELDGSGGGINVKVTDGSGRESDMFIALRSGG